MGENDFAPDPHTPFFFLLQTSDLILTNPSIFWCSRWNPPHWFKSCKGQQWPLHIRLSKMAWNQHWPWELNSMISAPHLNLRHVFLHKTVSPQPWSFVRKPLSPPSWTNDIQDKNVELHCSCEPSHAWWAKVSGYLQWKSEGLTWVRHVLQTV